MAMKRCGRCKGVKSVIGMGGMQHKCHVCSGIGHVNVVDEADEQRFLAKPSSDSTPPAHPISSKTAVPNKTSPLSSVLPGLATKSNKDSHSIKNNQSMKS